MLSCLYTLTACHHAQRTCQGILPVQALAEKVLTKYGFDLVSKSPAIFTEGRPQQAMLLYPRTVLGTPPYKLCYLPPPVWPDPCWCAVIRNC